MAKPYSVFLSHNSAEKAAVEYLARQIRNEGFTPWLDSQELAKGANWLQALEEGLKNSESCAAIVGPHGFNQWHLEEIQTAIRLRVESGGKYPVIPVLLPGIDSAGIANLPLFLSNSNWVKFNDLDDREALLQLIDGFAGKKPARPADPTETDVCPYRGLRFFDIGDDRFFFGREVLTKKLLDAIRPDDNARLENRFLAVTGDSGSGKSSLVRAGLLARIKAGHDLPGSETWPIIVLRPGKDPLESLATALFKTPGFTYSGKPGSLPEDLKTNSTTLHLASACLAKGGAAQRVAIFVDQFEELFSLCDSAEARLAFIENLLHAAVNVSGGHVVFLLAMRSEFSGKCADYPAFANAMRSQFVVGAMEEHELEKAIAEPARQNGVRVDGQVVQRLILFGRNKSGCLPLVQDTLADLWDNRVGNTISLDSYKSLGGVDGALGTRAERVYGKFDSPSQEACERIFLRLVFWHDGSYLKRRVAVAELLPGGEAPAEAQRVHHIIEALEESDARLVITGTKNDQPGGEPVVEIIHESLINSWARLKDWLAAGREFQFWRRRLETARAEWIELKKNREQLLRGPALVEAANWLEQRPRDLNADEQGFIRDSIQAQKDRDAAEKKQQEDLLNAERLAAKRARLLAAAALSLAGAVGAFLLYMRLAEAKIDSNRLAVIARDQSKPEVGVLIAMHALRRSESKSAFEALEYTMQAARQPLVDSDASTPVIRFAFSKDGKLVASAHENNVARATETEGGKLVQQFPHSDRLTAIAFSPAGDSFATACADGIARVWKLSGPPSKPAYGTPLKDGALASLDFNANGSQLATGSFAGALRVWGTPSLDLVYEMQRDSAQATQVAFHPKTGQIAAGYSDGAVLLWSTGSEKPRGILAKGGKINDLKFSPNGERLAIAADSRALVCDLTRGNSMLEAGFDSMGIAGVAISPDGKDVAMAGLGGTIIVFDLFKKTEMLRLAYPGSSFTSAAFQPAPPSGGEVLGVGGKPGVLLFELNLEKLRTQARAKIKATDPQLTEEQCNQYLGGKNCKIVP